MVLPEVVETTGSETSEVIKVREAVTSCLMWRRSRSLPRVSRQRKPPCSL